MSINRKGNGVSIRPSRKQRFTEQRLNTRRARAERTGAVGNGYKLPGSQNPHKGS